MKIARAKRKNASVTENATNAENITPNLSDNDLYIAKERRNKLLRVDKSGIVSLYKVGFMITKNPQTIRKELSADNFYFLALQRIFTSYCCRYYCLNFHNRYWHCRSRYYKCYWC